MNMNPNLVAEHKYPDAISGEDRYVEYDVEFEQWGIFGLDSGHCYGMYATEDVANEKLENRIGG